VERANQTLQDRLIKELRLQGINDLDAANALGGISLWPSTTPVSPWHHKTTRTPTGRFITTPKSRL